MAEREASYLRALAPFGAEISIAHLSRAVFAQLPSWTRKYRLLILHGLGELSSDELLRLASAIGEPMSQGTSLIVDIREIDNQFESFLFSSAPVPLHYDGALGSQAPDLVMLRCHRSSLRGGGGEGLYVDTVRSFQLLAEETKETLRASTVIYQLSDGSARTIPLIARDMYSTFETIRLVANIADDGWRNDSIEIAARDQSGRDVTSTLLSLVEQLSTPVHCYTHIWSAGDIVLVNNHAILHGRRSFPAGAGRHLQRVHIRCNDAITSKLSHSNFNHPERNYELQKGLEGTDNG
ncbi:TauD/TfdA family dioxygenase [Caballeronia sp. AZ1_KS37]|uniref:TauD/TfdA family dioxygenase n=1 Tax=Caballeronia sp. AZ1_KS37 TaxID=2921756 RepID=UPI002027CED6|nr:TauD/TfdA family dioxygenase [Caballeronia sp. AZ1_KS37]